MRTKQVKPTNKIEVYNATINALPIEMTIEKMIAQEIPVVQSMAYMGTEAHEGVKAETDIRTNRFEIAHDLLNKITGNHREQRVSNIAKNKEMGTIETQNPTSGANIATTE